MSTDAEMARMWGVLIVDEAADEVDEARIRASWIKFQLGEIADSRDNVLYLVERAKEARDDDLLGYPSWTAYVAGEFSKELAELRRDVRRDVVQALSATGMSTRAIASVVGVSNSTVHEDIKVIDSTVRLANSRPSTVTSLDGRERPASQQMKPRRKPLTDAFWDASTDLNRLATRLENLHKDDRFAQNRDGLRRHRADLFRAQTILRRLIEDLGDDQGLLP